MWEHNKEAMAAVEEFNEKVMDIIGQDREFSTDHMMTLQADGTQATITFMGVRLWFSEEDDRDFDEEKDEYEPLLEFLERKAIEELARFSRVLSPKTEGD